MSHFSQQWYPVDTLYPLYTYAKQYNEHQTALYSSAYNKWKYLMVVYILNSAGSPPHNTDTHTNTRTHTYAHIDAHTDTAHKHTHSHTD